MKCSLSFEISIVSYDATMEDFGGVIEPLNGGVLPLVWYE
jgi:hypothetical protein